MAGSLKSDTNSKIPIRHRRGVPKSRDGCLVCRARHVKCDEGRPACQKCTATGRRCEYSAKTPTETALTFVNYHGAPAASLDHHPDSSLNERRALSYFQHRAASELGGCFPELWSQFILPITEHDTAIKHAVVALVTLHEEYADPQPMPTQNSSYALKQYGKAVNQLLHLNSHHAHPDAVETALLSCIVFATLEMLRGHSHSSLTHVLSGKRILNEGLTRSRIPRHLLEDIFQRIETQVLSVNDRSFLRPVVPSKPVIPPVLGSVEEAYYVLEMLQNRISNFFSRAGRFIDESEYTQEVFKILETELLDFERLLHEWNMSFDRLTQTSSKAVLESRRPAILLLKILAAGMQTVFPVCRSRVADECDCDAYMQEFENMVTWAEAYVACTANFDRQRSSMTVAESQRPSSMPRKIAPKPHPVLTPTFSMSTGIIPSLYMCGSRCREPQIRRRALKLLQAYNRREGLWHSGICAQMVDRVIHTEEANAIRELGLACLSGSITSASQVSEMARVRVMGVQIGGPRTGEVSYRITERCEKEPRGARFRIVKQAISW